MAWSPHNIFCVNIAAAYVSRSIRRRIDDVEELRSLEIAFETA
jgi:hypothetical protein